MTKSNKFNYLSTDIGIKGKGSINNEKSGNFPKFWVRFPLTKIIFSFISHVFFMNPSLNGMRLKYGRYMVFIFLYFLKITIGKKYKEKRGRRFFSIKHKNVIRFTFGTWSIDQSDGEY